MIEIDKLTTKKMTGLVDFFVYGGKEYEVSYEARYLDAEYTDEVLLPSRTISDVLIGEIVDDKGKLHKLADFPKDFYIRFFDYVSTPDRLKSKIKCSYCLKDILVSDLVDNPDSDPICFECFKKNRNRYDV